ncbi:MAG: hypothetical protein FJX54_24185 [Alphaproteobacteria bacterium]|nr:hypothetical protein [Alphaproteobacteria bacterium]
MSSGLKTGLARVQAASAASPEEIGTLRRRAFVEHGVATIHLSDVADPWTRQAVINEARRQLESKGASESGLTPSRRRARR